MPTKAYQEQIYTLYNWYRQMRATQPVSREPAFPQMKEAWHVFRYADVSRVLSEHATFSSESRLMEDTTEQQNPISSSMLLLDQPRHHQLRRLVSQAFTPRMVAQLQPRIKTISHELLDQVIDVGKMDIIGELASSLPIIVIAELLGIPVELRDDFKRWSDALVASSQAMTQEERQARLQDIGGMFGYFTQVLEERRQRPQHDLVSALLQTEVDGKRLSDLELLGFCALLLVAGNVTTTNLIGNLILCLDEHPAVLQRLRADRQLLPGAIEEALRYYSPVKVATRTTTTKTTIGDVAIEADQVICAWIGSANRDVAIFSDAERFDIDRDPNRHVAFGRGIHFCLGVPLARLEATIALSALLDRLPGRWHVLNVPLALLESFGIFGLKEILMTWGG